MVEIDGGYLEGGGQIVRTAVGLSAATGTACRIFDIRKGRRRPGLAAQHLSSVRAAAATCGARLEGARAGSAELLFEPGGLLPPESIRMDVGTAGSVALVLQALMVPLSAWPGEVEVTITGGTHVSWSPTTDYFRHVCAWYLGLMGVRINVLDVRPGFYPKGGGRIRLTVSGGELKPLELTERGEQLRTVCCSLATSDLGKAQVAERQLEGAEDVMVIHRPEFDYVAARSTGTSVHMHADYANCRLGSTALGERGKRAEKVGRECAIGLRHLMAGNACLDEHMADQILPYMALAGGVSRVAVAEVTDHCRTNIWVIEKFLPVRFEVDEEAGSIACRKR